MKRSGKNEISAKGIGLLRRTAALLAALLLVFMSVAVGVLAEDATVLDVPPSPSYEEAAAPQAGEQPTAQAVARVPNVARSIARGVMSPSVTPRRNPSRPFLSEPLT